MITMASVESLLHAKQCAKTLYESPPFNTYKITPGTNYYPNLTDENSATLKD